MKLEKAVTSLSALAQESRIQIFRLLLQHENGVSAGEIAEQLGIPATTLSFHLSQLKQAGLIESSKDGRSIIYSANKKKAKKLTKFVLGKDLDEKEDSDNFRL